MNNDDDGEDKMRGAVFPLVLASHFSPTAAAIT
jgi:hypothetical protein